MTQAVIFSLIYQRWKNLRKLTILKIYKRFTIGRNALQKCVLLLVMYCITISNVLVMYYY